MTLNDRQKAGIAILVSIAAAITIWWVFVRESDPPDPGPDELNEITVVGYGGNIKVPFLEDPEVAEVLRERYSLTVDVEASDTQRMLCDVSLDGVDFLWAGDQSQIQVYEDCRSRSDFYRNIVNTPLVIYSWTDTTDALMEAGVASVDSDGVYMVDMLALMDLYDGGQTWNDLGFQNRPSRVIAEPTDPNQSTSGQLFAGLLANTMNCLDVVDGSTVSTILPSLNEYFMDLGFMVGASAELFRLYISQGEGSYPLVALLESQIVETVLANPQMVQQVENDIRMLYPQPTVWLTHPIIALTDGGRRLAEALLDPEIQQLGWEKNGFRPSVAGVQVDSSVLPIPGVIAELTSVIDTPANAIMDQIYETAATEYVADPNAPPPPDCAAVTSPVASPDSS